MIEKQKIIADSSACIAASTLLCAVHSGDNLEFMATQPSNSIDLIYSDVLYGTGRNFGDYQDLKPVRSEIENHYKPRLNEMYRILKNDGVIVLQMDYKITHWIRLIMDDLFGSIQNQIIWDYEKFCGKGSSLKNNHDTILVYSKGEGYTFNKLFYEKEKPKKQTVRVWDSQQKKAVQKKDENGKLMYYLQTDAALDDVWTDIPNINPMAKERLNYSTQKPIELIKRIVLIYSNEGDTVADFYLGSGTTAVVCKELNRNFIGCDINEKAVQMTKSRLNSRLF
jgi:DNA modification methylase